MISLPAFGLLVIIMPRKMHYLVVHQPNILSRFLPFHRKTKDQKPHEKTEIRLHSVTVIVTCCPLHCPSDLFTVELVSHPLYRAAQPATWVEYIPEVPNLSGGRE